jgi:hypothetical protein
VFKRMPVSSEGCIWWGTVAQAVSLFPCQLTFALALFSLSNMSGASTRQFLWWLFLFVSVWGLSILQTFNVMLSS